MIGNLAQGYVWFSVADGFEKYSPGKLLRIQ